MVDWASGLDSFKTPSNESNSKGGSFGADPGLSGELVALGWIGDISESPSVELIDVSERHDEGKSFELRDNTKEQTPQP